MDAEGRPVLEADDTKGTVGTEMGCSMHRNKTAHRLATEQEMRNSTLVEFSQNDTISGVHTMHGVHTIMFRLTWMPRQDLFCLRQVL